MQNVLDSSFRFAPFGMTRRKPRKRRQERRQPAPTGRVESRITAAAPAATPFLAMRPSFRPKHCVGRNLEQ